MRAQLTPMGVQLFFVAYRLGGPILASLEAVIRIVIIMAVLQSRWRVFALESSRQRVRFKSEGFGPGEFHWKFPQPGNYNVITTNNLGKRQHVAIRTDENGLLTLSINQDTAQPITIEIGLVL